MLREVCFDVQKEPVLLLSGEQFRLKSANTAQEARPDVSARSVWNNLSVPPGLGQRQQSLSLTFSVFFLAARSQVLPPFFFFFFKNQTQFYLFINSTKLKSGRF